MPSSCWMPISVSPSQHRQHSGNMGDLVQQDLQGTRLATPTDYELGHNQARQLIVAEGSSVPQYLLAGVWDPSMGRGGRVQNHMCNMLGLLPTICVMWVCDIIHVPSHRREEIERGAQSGTASSLTLSL